MNPYSSMQMQYVGGGSPPGTSQSLMSAHSNASVMSPMNLDVGPPPGFG